MTNISIQMVVFLLIASAPSQAVADVIRCKYDRWGGADRMTAQAAMGDGFELADESQIRLFDEQLGVTDWSRIEVVEGPRFRTFTTASEFGYAGWEFSFRIMLNGDCEGRMDHQQYYPIGGYGSLE